MEDMLARVPGVEVLPRGGSNYSIRIRGITTLSGKTDPLVVVDGMPVSDFGIATALSAIRPQDVERIDVLKDAGATSIYGLRGTNGVIVITTRRR